MHFTEAEGASDGKFSLNRACTPLAVGADTEWIEQDWWEPGTLLFPASSNRNPSGY